MANNRGKKVSTQARVKRNQNEKKIAEVASLFYQNRINAGLSSATIAQYKTLINHFLKWLGADSTFDAIDDFTFENYTRDKMENGANAQTIKTALTHLKVFMNFCIEHDFITQEEVIITIPKVEKKVKETYTEEELLLLTREPKSADFVEWRCWAMVNYCIGTGQRLSTMLNIKVEDLDLERKQVFLAHNKDKIQKYMPLSTATVKILERYLELTGLEDEEYLFPNYEGGELAKRSCQDAMRDYNHARGVQRTGIHLFRHTFAKNYILNGGNPAKLQKLMNHKQIETTMVYVNLFTQDFSNDLDLFNPLDNIQKKVEEEPFAREKRRKGSTIRINL